MGKLQQNALFSMIQEGVIIFDELGIITYVNKSALTLLEFYKKDLVGEHIDTALKIYNNEVLILRKNGIFTTVFKKNSAFTCGIETKSFLVSKSGERLHVDLVAKKIPEEDTSDNKEQGVLIITDKSKLAKLQQYKDDTINRLGMLTPILQKISVGDYSSQFNIPEDKNEFTELFVALKIIFSDLALSEVNMKGEENTGHKEYEKEGWQLVQMAGRKTTELKEAKSHMESILENLSSGLIEFDGSFRIKRMNASAERMVGVLREDIVGKKLMPEDVHLHESWESLVLVSYPILDPNAKRLKKKVFGVDASAHLITVHFPMQREIEVITIPLSDKETGVREGFIKVLRDVTRESMIAKSKSEFISVAAHQLRTPLSGMKWVMRMILDGDVGKINATQQKLLNKGYQTNEKMIRLVNDLLNVARIEDGRFGYQFELGDFPVFVDDIIDGLQVNASEKNINIKFEKDQSINEFLYDSAKMSIVVQNLVDNAIKYTPNGGDVFIELSNIGDFVRFTVQDTGIGIPKGQLDRLFTKFFRAENAVKTQANGSGLGLFIVKNIITRHGGRITVESIENKGSKFIFVIPTKQTLIPRQDSIAFS